jgi:CubicO group peptidase (beta-lactamase class C family)
MERLAITQWRVIGAFLISWCVPDASSAQFGGADFDRVDAFVEAQIREANIPGVAIAVVSRDRPLHLRGFGVAGRSLIPVNAETPFLLASVSKPITALALMRLVEAGKIDLNAPVQRYLPWFEVMPRARSTDMTVKHVLTHTSGFSLRDGRRHYDSLDDSDTAIQSRVQELARIRLRAAPGERFEYTNANYDVAGAMIEAVSGQRYEHFVERYVFAPLKMTRSFTSAAAAAGHGLAEGHRYWFGRLIATESLPRPRPLVASSQLFASAADMGRLLRMYLNGGALDGERILSQESITAMLRPGALVGGRLHYALGWFVDEIEGRRILSHSGIGPDYSALVSFAPDEGWGLAVLVNAENQLSGPNVDALGFEVRRLLMGQPARPIRRAAGIFTPELMGMVVLLGVQVIAAIHTLLVARQWKRDPNRHPQSRLRLAWHFLLPPTIGICLAIYLVIILPRTLDTTLRAMRIHAPDGALMIGISAIIACIWAVVRTVLLLRSTRAQPASGASRLTSQS